jgi:hypothetical protein
VKITTRISKDAKAVAVVAVIFLLVAIVGFTPKYFGPLFVGGYESPSSWMHAHVISALLWLTLFLIQPLLILRRKLDRHRRFGRFALLVALVTAVTGIAIQFDLLPITPGDDGNLSAFTARFIAGMGLFIPAIVFAVIYRRRTAWHLRLMYLATMSLMPSPFGRIMVHYLGMSLEAAAPLIAVVNLLMAAALPIYDRLAHGRVERISWIILAAVTIALLLIGFLLGNSWWAAVMAGQ